MKWKLLKKIFFSTLSTPIFVLLPFSISCSNNLQEIDTSIPLKVKSGFTRDQDSLLLNKPFFSERTKKNPKKIIDNFFSWNSVESIPKKTVNSEVSNNNVVDNITLEVDLGKKQILIIFLLRLKIKT